jgi:hypothetical protein
MRAVKGSWIRFACCSVILSASLTACGGGSGGSSSAQSTDAPDAPITAATGNVAPQISGTAPTAIAAGETYSFAPTATDPNQGDQVTFTIVNKPKWAEFNALTGLLSGKPASADAGAYHGVEIAATDGNSVTPLPAFTIVVSPAAVTGDGVSVAWQPPTQNDDGSTLTDLSGYKIHYGTTPGSYSDSVAVQNPGLTRYDLSSLPKGQVFIAMTAVNASGAESEYSPEVAVMVN